MELQAYYSSTAKVVSKRNITTLLIIGFTVFVASVSTRTYQDYLNKFRNLKKTS